ncbi:hypothetical protein SUDANB145_04609 [Streptomyces sp. enrichment culture]|uniref:DUF397 domain-containing protein n=1 Tax=Streptomyces sp. enrichment culture TaxID=1795815 RepID=UPI003F55C9DA
MPAPTTHPRELTWFKSTYSGANATECLEAAFVPPGVVIRDSKRREGSWVRFSAQAWGSFVDARKAR